MLMFAFLVAVLTVLIGVDSGRAQSACDIADPAHPKPDELVDPTSNYVRPACQADYGTVVVFSVVVRTTPTPAAGYGWSPFPGAVVTAQQGDGHSALATTDANGDAVILFANDGPVTVVTAPPSGYQLEGLLLSSPGGTATADDVWNVVRGNPLTVQASYVPVPAAPELGITLSVSQDPTGIIFDTLPIDEIDPKVLAPAKSTGTAVNAAPISSIDLEGTPISSIPISSIPISSIPISSIPISSIPISSISWDDLLRGTPYEGTPTHEVTFQELLDLPGGQGYQLLSQVSFADADFFAMGLGKADVYALLLGGAPLSAIAGGQFCGSDYASLDCGSSLLEEELQGSGVAGAPISSIPISSIPISSIPISSIPISSIPISSIPISSIPISSIETARPQLDKTRIDAIPAFKSHCTDFLTAGIDCQAGATLYDLLNHYATSPGGLKGSPISSITLDALPISSIPISSIPISSIPISSIPISSIPISSIGGLKGIPISSIAVKDVDALCETLVRDLGINLADCLATDSTDGTFPVDLASVLTAYSDAGKLGSSPFASIPISSIPISSIPISSIPISSIPISSIPISSIPISSIPISSIETQKTLLSAITISSMGVVQECMALGIAGLDCQSASLYDLLSKKQVGPTAAPISSIPISSIPISSIPISSIANNPVAAVPISSIPISSILVDGTPISSIPISSIDFNGTPISSIPISSIAVAPSSPRKHSHQQHRRIRGRSDQFHPYQQHQPAWHAHQFHRRVR